MTVQALLKKINDEKPNSFTTEQLLVFVNEIEAEVAEQLQLEAPVYTDDEESLSRLLLVPAPYDKLYSSYVKSMVDAANEEYAPYQLNRDQHIQDFSDFVNWDTRTNHGANEQIPRRFRNVF